MVTTEHARREATPAYSGPKWPEWVLSLACAILTASLLTTKQQSEAGQSAQQYYFQTPGISELHLAAVIVNLTILVSVLVWVIRPALGKVLSPFVGFLSFGAVLMCWYEVIRAVGTQPNPIYVLQELPFRPVNNLGLLGASLFLAYLMFRMPYGFLERWRSNLIRFGLAFGVFLCQTVAYEFFVRGRGL